MKKIIRKILDPIVIWWALQKVARDQTAYGAEISVQHCLSPEANATVQSLNSRSAGGFIKNLKYMLTGGDFKKFMASFYSGYGHKSIGDCGTTTGSMDNISMLGAKGIQDWQLYNGQETSTRYINVTKLGYVSPLLSEKGEEIMQKWFEFYKNALTPTIEHLKKCRPKKENEDAKKWAVALEKRAYDILGSFLPAGARTNVSCHMTLRQWDDKLSYMVHHPLDEIQQMALSTLKLLQKKYPSTFKKKKVYPESEAFRKNYMHNFYLISQSGDWVENIQESWKGFNFQKNFQHDLIIDEYKDLLSTRPKMTEVPKALNEAGNYRLNFSIDFRSFRDLQRQRSATQRMPLLTMGLGFEEWYLDQLSDEIRQQAWLLLEEQKKAILALTKDENIRQYYIPMGYKVYTAFTIGLADMIYIIELRTPNTVHPTARIVAIKAYEKLKAALPDYFTIYADTSPDELSIKRAEQDLFFGEKRVSEM